DSDTARIYYQMGGLLYRVLNVHPRGLILHVVLIFFLDRLAYVLSSAIFESTYSQKLVIACITLLL
ncbi:MAG: hypothetical protein RR444_13255, partial [Oscillospiraceae bacterium]